MAEDPEESEENVVPRTNWEVQEPDGDWEKPPIPPWVKPLVIVLTILAIGAGLVFWKRASIRHYANEWTAERHLAKAETELEAGRPKIAVRRAMTSQGLKANRIDTLRLLLIAGREAQDARVLAFAQTVFLHPLATIEDQAVALAAVNDVRDGARFEQLYGLLEPDEQAHPEVVFEWLRSRLILGKPGELLAALDPEKGEPNLPKDLLRWRALMALNTPETDAEAGLLAARLVGEYGEATEEDRERLGEWIGTLALLPPERWEAEAAGQVAKSLEGVDASDLDSRDFTLPLTLSIAAQPEQREAILEAAVADGTSLAVEKMDSLCLFLRRLQESDRLLALLEANGGAKSPTAYECQVDALIRTGQLEEAMGLMEFPLQGVDRIALLAKKAAVARELGRSTEETSAWREALLEAERDLTKNHYLQLARLAQRAGETEVAAESIVGACQNPLGILPPVREIGWVIGYLAKSDRAEDLRSVTNRLLQGESSHPVLLNNAVYLNTVMRGEARAEEIQVMERLREQYPGVTQMRTTLALAYLTTGRKEEALALLEPERTSSVRWQELSPAGRSVFALVLAETGENEHFLKVHALIDAKELLAIERSFYEDAFAPHLPEPEEELDGETVLAPKPTGV